MLMSTIHEQLDELLAADLHDELTAAERDEFHAHLVECAECRQAFQEGKTMNRILNETLAEKKADPAFEQRMVSRFRDRVPKRAGLIGLITDLMRVRAVQLTAAAALLLALAQMGRMITGESMTPKTRREDYVSNRVESALHDNDQEKPGATRETAGMLSKADGRNKTVAPSTVAPAPPPMDAVTSTAPKSQSETLRTPAKTKKTEFKEEKSAAADTTAETLAEPAPSASATGPTANRKLVRNATAELEVVSFDDSVQKITGFAAEEKGYVSTTSSEKQANGKLRGEIVVKVLPDNLDRFLGKLRGIGDLKNQALTTEDVTKAYFEIKALASPKVQITNAQIDRDNTGRVSARLSLLLAPEESEAVINKIKGMARVENFQVTTDRVSQGGDGLGESAKTERDKVELNITLSRDEQEIALQQTSLRIQTPEVNDKTKQLRALAEQQGGRIRSSSFSRDPNGREYSSVSLRVPMKNYNALMQSLNGLGRVENVSVRRDDRPNSQIDEANAPADVTIQVYSQGNIVSEETGIWATLRRTIGQGAAALMWSVRMIGVAIAFLAPWALILGAMGWIARRVARARTARKQTREDGGQS